MMLKDRITVVTGATRGIGRAIALEAARNGSDVVLLGTERRSSRKCKSRN